MKRTEETNDDDDDDDKIIYGNIGQIWAKRTKKIDISALQQSTNLRQV